MTLNRRVFRRSLTDIRAVARWEGEDGVACVVRDQSDGGARVVFLAASQPPMVFDLELKGSVLRAHLIWSDGRQVGIRLNPTAPHT